MTAKPDLHGRAVAPGSIIADKYVIERVIGKGGMGVILAAKHLQLDQRVAIKVLTADAALDIDRVQRFLREAKAVALIQSDYVVRVFDFGSVPSGEPFLVMEHLEGCDLAEVLKTRGGLPLADAVEYILQACEGVAEAHELGIIHRDLKPANLFLTRKKDGSPAIKVLDFGASKLTSECKFAASDPSKTHESSLIGSPRYMAPEQLKAAQRIDARVDVYALGATLYELLAGEPAFFAETIPLTFSRILWEAPASLRAVRPDVPKELEAAILRALAKTPDERFSSVNEFAAALAPFGPERAKSVVIQKREPPTPNRARRIRQWTTGTGLLFLVGAAALLLARHGQVAPPMPQPARSTTSLASAPAPLPEAPPIPEAITPPAPAVRAPAHAHSKPSPRPSASDPYSKFGARQ